jgi:hypothetical protein
VTVNAWPPIVTWPTRLPAPLAPLALLAAMISTMVALALPVRAEPIDSHASSVDAVQLQPVTVDRLNVTRPPAAEIVADAGVKVKRHAAAA